MTSPPPLASLQKPQVNKDLGWDPGELLRSDFVDASDRDAFPTVLSEERAHLTKNRSNDMNRPVDSSHEQREEHDPQLNAAAHNAPAEQRETEAARKGTEAQSRQNEGEDRQELQASKAEQNAGAEEAENETINEATQDDEAIQNEDGESVDDMVRQELALTDTLRSNDDAEALVQVDSEQQNQAAVLQLKGSQSTTEARLQAQAVSGNRGEANQAMHAESMDARVDSRAEQIVDYLVENSTSKRKGDRQENLNNVTNTDSVKAGMVGERAIAENLNSTRDLLQNLISADGKKKARSTSVDAQAQTRTGQSVNAANTTPVENRLANTAAAVTNAAATTRLRQGSGTGQEQQNWDGLPGQTAWQGSITGAKNNAGRQLPIAQQARNLMMQAAQALPAQKAVEGRRLSLTLPMEKHGPVRMILRPGAGDSHQMTFIVNSANAAAALRRILPELEETASTFPVEVADISIVTQENQPTTEDSIGFSANKTSARSTSNEV